MTMKKAYSLADVKSDPRVERVQIEYDTIYEPTGKLYIVFLANGWVNEHLECSRIQETTVKGLLWQLNGTVSKV